MFMRNMRKSDYAAVDTLLLQIHQVDVDGRPEMFAPIEQYMSKDSYDSLVASKNVISILAQEQGKIIGCCFASMLERSGMAHMKSPISIFLWWTRSTAEKVSDEASSMRFRNGPKRSAPNGSIDGMEPQPGYRKCV